MTENQLFSMSTEYFDGILNSTNNRKNNNSRPFKRDLYSTVNSLSSSGDITAANTTTALVLSNLHKNQIKTCNSNSNSCNSDSNSNGSINSSAITCNTFEETNYNGNNNTDSGNCRSAMLSNAISIPRSNTSANQNHHAFQDDIRHHHNHHHLSFSPYLRYHQQYQQQQHYQQQRDRDQHHITNKDNININNNTNNQMTSQMLPVNNNNNSLKSTTTAASLQGNSPQAMSTDYNDFTDYGLDALDASSSLSPTLLQDVNLSAATQHNNQMCNDTTTNTNNSTTINSPFFLAEHTSSPLSQSYNDATSSCSAAIAINTNNVDISGAVTLLGIGNNTGKDDSTNTLLYEGGAVNNNPNNIIWNDIDSTIISMKNEPFTLEDDYIFAIDKNEINDAGFVDIGIVGGDDHFLDTIAIEEFFHANGGNGGSNGSNNCFLPSSSPFHNFGTNTTSSPDMGPPLELMQQQQQQQQQHHQHHQQQEQQKEQQQQQQQQLLQLQNVPTSLRIEGCNREVSNNRPTNGVLQQHQQQQQLQQASSSSQYDTFYKKSPLDKVKLAEFTPASQPSHSPMQLNSITPPLSVNSIRSQFQQQQQQQQRQQQQLQMQDMLRKGFSFSPDTNGSSNPLLGQSIIGGQTMLFSNQSAVSPSSGSSGFGSTNGGNHSSFMDTAPAISINSSNNNNRKPFYLTMAATEATALSRLSSSAPTHLGREHIWMRREPRQHLLSTGSLAEADSFSSLSTVSILSPDANDYSQDDDDDVSSEDNSDNYDDLSSDNGSDNEDELQSTIRRRTSSLGSNQQHLSSSSSKAKERYFWQYNVQAKGPKGKRLVFQCKVEDPHVLNEITDPVFSPNCSVKGIKVYKHSGKARKGDGNDLTPNPRKLHNIGRELDRLSRTINDMTPVSELPFNARPKSRKEKNKLASRACRLKKKAQHEANKIKLYGLEIEHKRLLNAISDIKLALVAKYRKQNAGESVDDINQEINTIYTNALNGIAIAGVTTDFVNKVLENIKNGLPTGGLDELKNS